MDLNSQKNQRLENSDEQSVSLRSDFVGVYQEGIPKEGDIDSDVFTYLYSIKQSGDEIEYNRCYFACVNYAKKMGRKVEFEKLFKLYEKRYNSKEETSKKGDLERNNERQVNNATQFGKDAPLQVPCGDYVTSEIDGVLLDEKVICPHPILISNRFRNIDDENKSRVEISFKSRQDDPWEKCIVNQSVIANKASIICLSDYSVRVTSDNSGDLVRYFSTLLDEANNYGYLKTKRSISRLGWYDDFQNFLPFKGDAVFDADEEFGALIRSISRKGSFDVWKACLNKERQNSEIVRIVTDAALCAPLIEMVGGQCFFVHVWGTTSFGKTLLLNECASIWGNPKGGGLLTSLNSTENYMFRKCATLHNIPFFGDELQTVKANMFSWNKNGSGGPYDKFVMSLSEGSDRGKAKARGGIEAPKSWYCPFITTGEEPIVTDHSGGGAKNRVLQIECERKLFTEASGSSIANTLRKNYGFAGPAFIESIFKDKDFTQDDLVNRFNTYSEQFGRHHSDKQAAIGALIRMTDEMACCAEIFGRESVLPPDVIGKYLMTESEVRTEMRAYEILMDVIATNESKFTTSMASERWGKFNGREATEADMVTYDSVYIIKTVLDKILRENGFEFDAVKKKWARDKLILRDENNSRFDKSVRINGAVSRCVEMKMRNHQENSETSETSVTTVTTV